MEFQLNGTFPLFQIPIRLSLAQELFLIVLLELKKLLYSIRDLCFGIGIEIWDFGLETESEWNQ